MHEQILDALRRGAAAEALSAARDAVAAAPQDATAQRLLATALQQSGDRPAALAVIDTALNLTPDDAGLHVERAGLLLDARQLGEAESALARAVGLDPNQFPVYIIQGHLAMARGDLPEAERLVKTAARITPEHPQVAALEGMVALRRGDADRALAVLSHAAKSAPEEPTLRNALGYAYIAKGHFAFAEQCFRAQLKTQPDSIALRALIADLMRRQGRPAQAADEIAPLLERANVSPGLQRVVGELELEAGRTERALPRLKAAFAAMPRDRRTLEALLEAWRRTNDANDARSTLETALAAHPEEDSLWRARLVFEPFAGQEALAIVERWQDARPDHVPALQARAAIHDHTGETDEADAIAYQIVAIEPGQPQAELRIVNLLLQNDPSAAVARVQALLARAQGIDTRQGLHQLMARCFVIAGDPAAAVATWAEMHAEVADQRLPLPPLTSALPDLPPQAPFPEETPGVLLVWGAPGSLVERVAQVLHEAGTPLRADRFGLKPPVDPLQRYGTAQELLDGRLDGGSLISQWRAALPSRGIGSGPVFDWLLWWDKALVLALRPHLPEALLMIAVRDPRDMLLDWLAWGAPGRFKFESPEIAARWLAAMLDQVADLHEQRLFPHQLLRLDDAGHDPAMLATLVGQSMRLTLPPPQSLGAPHFPPGRWRAFAQPLAEGFATLTPVATRLGYPEN